LGWPHPRWIEAVVAVVVIKPSEQLLESQVMEHLRRAHGTQFKGAQGRDIRRRSAEKPKRQDSEGASCGNAVVAKLNKSAIANVWKGAVRLDGWRST